MLACQIYFSRIVNALNTVFFFYSVDINLEVVYRSYNVWFYLHYVSLHCSSWPVLQQSSYMLVCSTPANVSWRHIFRALYVFGFVSSVPSANPVWQWGSLSWHETKGRKESDKQKGWVFMKRKLQALEVLIKKRGGCKFKVLQKEKHDLVLVIQI